MSCNLVWGIFPPARYVKPPINSHFCSCGVISLRQMTPHEHRDMIAMQFISLKMSVAAYRVEPEECGKGEADENWKY